jgi:hypothetical protein
MARTTGRPGTAASIVAIGTPAAIETTSASGGNVSTHDSSDATTSFGFTATTTTSASATAHAALGTTRASGNRASST